jgi:hypothetical protein
MSELGKVCRSRSKLKSANYEYPHSSPGCMELKEFVLCSHPL